MFRTLLQITSAILIVLSFSGCGLFGSRPETPDEIIQKASHQKIFLAPYDQVWRAAHTTLKYTIASENQDYGMLETDYVKSVDGWLPPFKTKPDHGSSRYKLTFTFAKGQTGKRESTRVTIEKKIEIFKNILSDVETIPSDGLEEAVIFYRMERELIIAQALKKASEAEQEIDQQKDN